MLDSPLEIIVPAKQTPWPDRVFPPPSPPPPPASAGQTSKPKGGNRSGSRPRRGKRRPDAVKTSRLLDNNQKESTIVSKGMQSWLFNLSSKPIARKRLFYLLLPSFLCMIFRFLGTYWKCYHPGYPRWLSVLVFLGWCLFQACMIAWFVGVCVQEKYCRKNLELALRKLHR